MPSQHARLLLVTLALLALLAAVNDAPGQLPVARLDRIFPPGAQAGQTVEVTLGGEFLDRSDRLVFSHAGIQAEPTQPVVETSPNPVPFRVALLPDVPAGTYEVRVQGRFGLSNPRLFVVGNDPETRDNGSNHELGQAQELGLNQVLNGMADGQAVDYYIVTLNQGHRLTIDCEARGIDSRLDPVLVVLDAKGRERARQRRGGILEFVADAQGAYLIAVHDFEFEGGPDYAYRLRVEDRPRVDFAFPSSLEPGTTAPITLYGRRLPGGEAVPDWVMNGAPLERVTVEVTAPDAASFRSYAQGPDVMDARALGLRQFLWNWKAAEDVTVPVPLDLALAPVGMEEEPNDQPDTAQAITLPAEMEGRLYPRGDVDWFEFETEQGKVYWIDMIAGRKGIPINPFFLMQRVRTEADGKEKVEDVKELYKTDENLGGKDFDTTTGDVSWRFEAGGERYRIRVDDLFGHARPRPDYLYRLSIRHKSPDYELAVVPVQPIPDPNQRRVLLWSVSLRKGETWPLRVIARRQDAFFEPIEVTVEGLPEGVRSERAVIPRGQNFTWVYVSAAADAEPWAGPVRVVGHAQSGERTLDREASAGVVLWTVGDYNNETIHTRLSPQFTLSVMSEESTPLRVAAAEPKTWEGPVGSKMEIPLKVERLGDFNQTLKLKAVGLAPLAKLPEIEVKEKEGDATLVIDLGEYKLEEGEYEFALFTATKGKYRNQPEVAERAKAAATKAGEEAALRTESLKKADEEVQQFKKQWEQAEAKVKDARDKVASASEGTKDAIQILLEQAEAGLQESLQVLQQSEASKKEAEEHSKQAEAAKKQAEEQAKAAEERAKPKDLDAVFYSDPIRIKVTPAPEPAP